MGHIEYNDLGEPCYFISATLLSDNVIEMGGFVKLNYNSEGTNSGKAFEEATKKIRLEYPNATIIATARNPRVVTLLKSCFSQNSFVDHLYLANLSCDTSCSGSVYCGEKTESGLPQCSVMWKNQKILTDSDSCKLMIYKN